MIIWIIKIYICIDGNLDGVVFPPRRVHILLAVRSKQAVDLQLPNVHDEVTH